MTLASDRRRRNRIDASVERAFTQPILRVIRREEKRVLAATTASQAVGAVREAEWVKVLVSLWLSPPVLELWGTLQTQLGTDIPITAEARKVLTDAATANGKAIAATRKERIERVVNPAAKADRFRPDRTFRSTRRAALQELYANVTDQAGAIAHTQALSATETVRYESARATSAVTPQFRVVKVWFTMGDNHVRSTHAAVNGQSRMMTTPAGKRVRSTFRVGGANLEFPRQPGGEPSQVINCRCFLEYRRIRRK